ncbi:hypothetical protein ACFO4N_00205 [Camelliibacillus cellulosilyticus]|uniref:Spore germination protein GerPA/GerPF n=1 Tax=Camelliibacillus cellulosilyticus TaxID=2174486 RepID=A0ABV9GGV9_9BACL
MIIAPMAINFLGFKVNSLDRSSSVIMGPAQQVDIFQSNKRNQGFGEENGDLDVFIIPINTVADPDLFDNGPSPKTSLV